MPITPVIISQLFPRFLFTAGMHRLNRVESTTHRFRDGYNYFGRYPQKVLAFFDKHMKAAAGNERRVGASSR